MQKLIITDMSDVCEEAHRLTVNECERLHIPFEVFSKGDVFYTAQAQIIFDKHYNHLIEKYNI